MVNIIEGQKPLLHALVRMAGLRPVLVELEPGTVMHFWAPKHRLPPQKKKKKKSAATITIDESTMVVPESNTTANTTAVLSRPSKNKACRIWPSRNRPKPAIVLVHGFASEGIVTWQFQFGVLVSDYDVYIPDLFFFGKSMTDRPGRSPEFQADCVGKALDRLGVGHCHVVGFSYGGMVAFKLAEARPRLVRSLVVTGSVIAMTDSINEASLTRLGVATSAELLMPETLERLKALLKMSMYKKLWLPDRFHKDYLKVMFDHRKERRELLEGLVISNRDAKIPSFQQKIMLIWGENDNIFNIELAKKMREQLGENTSLVGISKAGHLLHMERPCAFNRYLKRFLSYVDSHNHDDDDDDDDDHNNNNNNDDNDNAY